MRIAELANGIWLSLALTFTVVSVAVAQERLTAYQGAWLPGSLDCAEIYTSTRSGLAFKKPVDIFAPAFIISGNRLTTPQASCRIKSIQPSGDRQLLVLGCANAVAGDDVRVLMSLQSDGLLKRYFNAEDSTGTAYRLCSR